MRKPSFQAVATVLAVMAALGFTALIPTTPQPVRGSAVAATVQPAAQPVDRGHVVTFTANGSPGSALVAWSEAPVPSTTREQVPLPWSAARDWRSFPSWPQPARIEVRNGPGGWVSCSIAADGQVLSTGMTTIPYGVARCDATIG